MPSSTPLRRMERRRATAPFATGPARRPVKGAVDSDDEHELPPPPSASHEEEHSGSHSSLFPALELYEEGEEGPADEAEDDLIQSQLQVQGETESQERRRQQEKRQQEEGEQSLGDLWRYMSDGENDEIENDEDEAVPIHASPEKPPPRKRRRRVVAVEKLTRRSRRLGVTNVLEQMSAAIGRAQPAQRSQQQPEEEGQQEAEAQAQISQQQETEQQQAEVDTRRQEEEGDGQTEEIEAIAEESRQQEQNEPREEGAAPRGAPERPPTRQQDGEATAATPLRMSSRLRGRAPTAEPDAPEEADANGAQPSTQKTAQTIQETPQATGDSGTIEAQSQGNGLNGDEGNGSGNDAEALQQPPGLPAVTAPLVTTALSIKTLNALLELMGSAGWTGKATWKIGLKWQHIDPGQFGPEPFTLQARNLLRQLGYLTDAYVQVPRPNARRRIELKNFDLRVQLKYLQDHDTESATLFSEIDRLVNGVCHDALQPLTTYAVETTRETVRFRWLLADDLVEFVIPKAIELLETVFALGGSLPDKELGVAAVYVPRNTVHVIHSTLYTARRVAGWIIRLENALAWELGYRADRRIPGGQITYLEDDDFDYEAGHRSFQRQGDDADAPPPPVSVATKRRDRSRLKPLLNKLEDELGLAWVALERARTAQEAGPKSALEAATEGVTNEDEDEDEDGDGPEWMPVEAAADQTPQAQTPRTRERLRRRPGRPRREGVEARKEERARQEQQRKQPQQQQPSQLQSHQQERQQSEPAEPETPPDLRRARAVIMADWDSSDNDDEPDFVPAPAAASRVGESLQIVLSQPPAASPEQAMVDINDDDDDDDDGDFEDDGQVDSPAMTTAAAAAAAAVRQPTPPVVSVEQETQAMIVVETSELEEEVEEEVAVEEEAVEEVIEAEAVEAEEAGDANAMQVDAPAEVQAEVQVEAQAEAPATPATDIPTPAPTPTPTLSPERAVSATGPRPYVDAELKQILARLRTLKGTAQLDLVKLAADLNRDVFDVANRAEGIKSVIRTKLLRDKKPVPYWAQAGYTIR